MGAYGSEAWGGWFDEEEDDERRNAEHIADQRKIAQMEWEAYHEALEENAFLDALYAEAFGDNCE